MIVGMTSEQLQEVLSPYADPRVRKTVAALLAPALLRTTVSEGAVQQIITHTLGDVQTLPPGWSAPAALARLKRLLEAILASSEGGGLLQLVSLHFLSAAADSGLPESPLVIPGVGRGDQPILELTPLFSREDSEDASSAIESIRLVHASQIAHALSMSREDVALQFQFNPRMPRMMRLIAWMQDAELLRQPAEAFLVEFEGIPLATLRYTTFVGNRPVSFRVRTKTAEAIDRYLASCGVDSTSFAVDTSSLKTLNREQYLALHTRRHEPERPVAVTPGASPIETAPPTPPVPQPNAVLVRVFYATDRDSKESKALGTTYGRGVSELTYGTCDVSIPRKHDKGRLEAPSILRLQFRRNPAEHVILSRVVKQSSELFHQLVSSRADNSPTRSAFIFVHGYNVSFEEAAQRTAVLAYDLSFTGAPVFFSWPSQHRRLSYRKDERNVELAKNHLQKFLKDFLENTSAQSVYVIAHSMGSRALTHAVAALLNSDPSLGSRVTEVILAAPDIDKKVFEMNIAPALTAPGRPVTLYASSEDLALKTSAFFNGGFPRAGDSYPSPVIVPGIETIDATGMDASFDGHSYIMQSRLVIADVFALVLNRLRAAHRFGLAAVDTPSGRYWKFSR